MIWRLNMSSGAFFLAGHPALDFLNTLAVPESEPVDFLPDGAALLAWLVKAGLIDSACAAQAARDFSARQLDALAGEARGLREQLRRALPLGEPVKVPAALRSALNALLAREARSRRLESAQGHLALVQTLSVNAPSDLLVPLAEACAHLLTEAEPALVKPCANPQCVLWFLDQTKAHRRLFCSAALCGNRHKVAAYRARQRAAAE